MTGMLLLTGANGRTGRLVLKSMVKAGIPVRAFIRDEAQAAGLVELGAHECAVGDMLDAASLRKACAGVEKILHIGPPMHPAELEIVDSLIDAAKAEQVRHFIYYSVMHPLSREIRHHRLKLDGEEHLIESGLVHTIIQPSRYMQHLDPLWTAVSEQGVHAMPFDIERKFSVVDLQDLADACAIVAASDRFHFGTYELAGPQALSQVEMAEILSRVLGRKVHAEAVAIEAMIAKARAGGASADRLEQMEIMNRHYDSYGFRSNPHVLESILGRPATTYEAYVERLARAKGAIA